MRHALVLAGLLLIGPASAGCIDAGSGMGGQTVLEPASGEDASAPVSLGFLAPETPLNLSLDIPVSWVGPRLKNALVVPLTPEPRCEIMPEDPCLYYPIEVPEGTAELRAALDRPDHRENVYLALLDPAGDMEDADGGSYTLDVRVEDPDPGAWTLRVDPQYVEDAAFRMRVQAIGDHGGPGPADLPEPALPNLKPIPAFDFHFDMPASQVGGSPAVPAGMTPTGCHPEEWALNGYEQGCLRFSFGWGNAGPGLFDARVQEAEPGSLTAPVTQRIPTANGSHEDRAAGTATVHRTHGHYHLDDVFEIEAFRVVDGGLVPAQFAAKRGSCMGDYVFMDWRAWDQQPAGSAGSNCGETVPWSGVRADPTDRRVAQTPGWGDVYFWELPDNYIVFDEQEDGEYVLRATVDPADVFVEADETDNTGYTHMVVHGSAVQVLERGYGQDPWDPDKQVIEGPWVT